MRHLYFIIMFPYMFFAQQGVGINTNDPQQALHIAGTTSTIRLDGLNAVNNASNSGDFDGNGNLSDNTFPLYINEDGDFLLDFNTLYISEDEDAIQTTTTITLNPFTNSDGNGAEEVFSFNVTTTRPTILEIKYNISFEVNSNAAGDEVEDYLSRRITNYFTVGGATYGIASKNFTNRTPSFSFGNTGSNETYYNVGRGYVSLPAAQTYTIRFFGEVSSGDSYLATSVVFGSGIDSLLFRMY